MSELGHRLAQLKRYRRRSVQRILRWALRLSWRPALAHLRMGRFLERQGRIDEALAAYRRATRKGPELAGGFYQLGTLLLAAKRQDNQAAVALRRFLDLEPRGRRAKNARARLKRLAARQRYLKASRDR